MINVSGSPVWKATILLSVSYPLLQWGKRYNTVNSAKTEVIKLQLQQGIVKDNISLQLNNAKTKLSENYKQIQIAYENLNIAAENMDLNTLRYNEGQLPILDVLSSQLSWIQANNSYVSALLAYKIAYAEYQYVSGAIDNGVQQP